MKNKSIIVIFILIFCLVALSDYHTHKVHKLEKKVDFLVKYLNEKESELTANIDIVFKSLEEKSGFLNDETSDLGRFVEGLQLLEKKRKVRDDSRKKILLAIQTRINELEDGVLDYRGALDQKNISKIRPFLEVSCGEAGKYGVDKIKVVNAGPSDCTMVFDGKDSCFSTKKFPINSGNDAQGAISLWFKDGRGVGGTVFSMGDTDEDQAFSIDIYNHGWDSKSYYSIAFGFGGGYGNKSWYAKTDDIVFQKMNDWHHLVVVQDGLRPQLHIDGEVVPIIIDESLDYEAWLFDYQHLDNARVGCLESDNKGKAHHFKGMASDIRYYNQALMPLEIKALHAIGRSQLKDIFGQNRGK